jgi:hypothetical protein
VDVVLEDTGLRPHRISAQIVNGRRAFTEEMIERLLHRIAHVLRVQLIEIAGSTPPRSNPPDPIRTRGKLGRCPQRSPRVRVDARDAGRQTVGPRRHFRYLLLVPQQIAQNIDARELHSACRGRQRPNRKPIPLPQPIDGRAGHADPLWEVIDLDDPREFACKPSGIFSFRLAQDRTRHKRTTPIASRTGQPFSNESGALHSSGGTPMATPRSKQEGEKQWAA